MHVGATSDPVEVPGLAHLCEHMLFLGTETYPVEDSFSTFMSANGEYLVVACLYSFNGGILGLSNGLFCLLLLLTNNYNGLFFSQ